MQKFPLTVFSGFWVAGETTFLSHILNNRQEKKVVVIVNDTSEINIDKSMIQSEVKLIACDQFAVRGGFAKGTFEKCGSGDIKPRGMINGAHVGCFPQLYQALVSNHPDKVINL